MYKGDGNSKAIVAALRAAGCSVEYIASANGRAGIPDLLVGRDGRNVILEIKLPKVGRLSPAQTAWHLEWRGQVAIVTTVEEALAAVGVRIAA